MPSTRPLQASPLYVTAVPAAKLFGFVTVMSAPAAVPIALLTAGGSGIVGVTTGGVGRRAAAFEVEGRIALIP